MSVGIRPALVCGWVMKPSSSSTAMSLRTVAGRDSQVVPLDQCLRTDRLLGLDVVLDDRSEDVELAVVEHLHLAPSGLALTFTECQCY